MILKDDGEIETEEESDNESMTLLEDASDIEYPVDEELLVIRRALSVQIKEYEKIQCENVFHARCHVNEKVCSMIINGGGYTNVATTSLVEKLESSTINSQTTTALQKYGM